MPPTTTKEHQDERNRRRSQDYRDRHPERARGATGAKLLVSMFDTYATIED